MPHSAHNSGNQPDTGAQFAQTQWSLVLAAVGGLSVRGEEALTQLCRIYWYPLYAFIRRRGHSPHEA